MSKCNGRRGFTLIELVVVIGIIALLVALLLPAVNHARKQARQVQCAANLRQLALAFNLYGQTNGRSFIYNGTGTPATSGLWTYVLRPCGLSDQILFCPEAIQRGPTPWGNANSAWGPGMGPVYAFMGTASGSYGMNGFLNIPTASPPPGTTTAQFYQFPMSGDASKIPVFGDATWFTGYPSSTDLPPTDSTLGLLPAGPISYMCYFATNRHPNKTVNMAFVDGHVDNLPLSDLWGLNWSVGYVAPKPLATVTN